MTILIVKTIVLYFAFFMSISAVYDTIETISKKSGKTNIWFPTIAIFLWSLFYFLTNL